MTERTKEAIVTVSVVAAGAAIEFALLWLAGTLLDIPGLTFGRIVGGSIMLHLAAMTVKRGLA